MREFYFDVETSEIIKNWNGTIKFESMKIHTIQFQEIDSGNDLTILTCFDWTLEKEQEMINQIKPILTCNPFFAVLVGKNIETFDMPLLRTRIGNEIGDRIVIDLSSICKIINIQRTGGLAGWGRIFPDKNTTINKDIPKLVENGNYETVLEYIRLEHEGFLKAYKKIKSELPKITFDSP